MKVKSHVHRAVLRKRKLKGFCGYSVRPDHPNEMAHGWATYRDECSCGATRLTNTNGPHTEYGPWEDD